MTKKLQNIEIILIWGTTQYNTRKIECELSDHQFLPFNDHCQETAKWLGNKLKLRHSYLCMGGMGC